MWSSTAHGIANLKEEVPKSIMASKMPNISQFYKFEWFKWIIFWDKSAPYPNDYFRLGLGLSIDIGLALMAKITNENSHIVLRSTYCELTQEEWK